MKTPAKNNASYTVTGIIPTFNEEKTIQEIVLGVKQYVDEIIVIVAKKTTDNTMEIAKQLGCKVCLDNGKGKGAALRLGIEMATKDIVLFIDADGSHDHHDIPKILKPIQDGRTPFVIGSRALGGSEEWHTTLSEFSRNVGGALIMLYINYLFNVRYTDCENGFRAVKRELLVNLHLTANDFDIEQEMVIKALKQGVNIVEVPAHEYKRKYGKSTLKLWRSGWKFIWRLLRELL